MHRDAIVVGGGMAGLAAAETLLTAGKSVLLLEAREDLGGRVRTLSYPDGTVLENGPSYIGPKQPHMMALVERFGLTLQGHDIRARSMGVNHLSPGFPYLSLQMCFQADIDTHNDLDDARRGIARIEAITRYLCDHGIDEPWKHARGRALDRITLGAWMDEEFRSNGYSWPMRAYVAEMLRMFVRTILSSEPEEMSALYFFWYLARCGGFRALTEGGVKNGPDSLRIEEGYAHLVGCIEREVRARGAQIETGAAVASISDDGSRAVVRLRSGESHTADRVVVAVPPFVADKIDFAMDLGGREELHRSMRPGRMIKGYARYREAWWKRFDGQSGAGGTPLVTWSSLANLVTGGGLDALTDCQREAYSGYSGYTNGTLEPIVWTMPATWRRDGVDHNPSLLWFVVGRAYDELRDLPAAARRIRVLESIARLHRHCRPSELLELIEVDWDDPREGRYGGPSGVLPPGALSRFGQCLRAPVGRLHWASTETARAWGGYMDGAVESGIRAAREILTGQPGDTSRPGDDGRPRIDAWWQEPPAATPATGCYAGFSVSELGLPGKLEMAGYGPKAQKGDRGEEKLYARALYLRREGGDEVALCAVDLHSCSTRLLRQVAEILEVRGLAEHQIVIAGTHTHSAPGRYHGSTFVDSVLQGPLRFPGPYDQLLAERLADDIARAIRGAKANQEPALFGVGTSQLWGHASQRSLEAFASNEDAASWNGPGRPGAGAPAELSPEERAVDPRVQAVAAFRSDGGLIGAFCTFGCHATSLGPAAKVYSRDWPGIAADEADQAIAGFDGHPRIAVALSAAGDISPLPPEAVRPEGKPEEVQGKALASERGRAVGEAIVAAVEAARNTRAACELEVASTLWDAPAVWRLGWPALGGAEDCRGARGGWFEEGFRWLDGPKDGQWPKMPVLIPAPVTLSPYHRLHRVRIGSHALVTLPGEPTVTFGARLEEALRSETIETLTVLGCAGDYAGYFTTPEEYAMQHYEGAMTLYGREVLTTLSAAFANIGARSTVASPKISDPPAAPTWIIDAFTRFCCGAERVTLADTSTVTFMIDPEIDLHEGEVELRGPRGELLPAIAPPFPFGHGLWSAAFPVRLAPRRDYELVVKPRDGDEIRQPIFGGGARQ